MSKTVESNSFLNNDSITSVYFGSECIAIGENAFKDCDNIYKINDDNVIENIGKNAFKNCINLTNITLSKCTNIGEDAFVNCECLEKVYILNEGCELDNENVFCLKSDSDSNYTINKKTYFYFPSSKIDYYKNNEYWKKYENYMFPLIGNDELLYISNNNEMETLDVGIKPNEHSYYNNSLGLIKFNEPIYKLDFKIFNNNSKKNITSIDIPSECIEITNEIFGIFDGYENLKHIKLPDTLQSIGDYTFKDCKKLETVTLPESIISFGEGIFAGCENLKEFKGSEKYVKNNGKSIIFNNTLISIIPNESDIIESRFYKIYNISEIDSNIKILGKSCFNGYKNLKRVDIPSKISEIHDYAFEGCENLCEVHFEGTVPPSLGEGVFNININGDSDSDSDSYSVREDFKIFVPEKYIKDYLTKWGSVYSKYVYPKSNKKDIIYSSTTPISEKHVCIYKYKDLNKVWYKIKNSDNNFNPNYFKNKSNITSVIVGENITRINDESFKNCISLEYVYLPDKITYLGDKCFYGCESLTRVHIPSGLKNIYDYIKPNKNNILTQNYQGTNITFGNKIFVGCKNLKEFGTYIKDLVSEDNRCYIHKFWTLNFFAQGDLDFENYEIPLNIKTINESAFEGCLIKSISGLDNVDTIGESAFSGCVNLNVCDINFSNNLKTIGKYAFKKSGSSVDSDDSDSDDSSNILNIPDSITEIGQGCFEGCSCIKKLTIGENCKLSSIQSEVFKDCSNLTTIDISNSKIKSIKSNAFYNCYNLINSEPSKLLPKNIISIGDYAFKNCSNITYVYLPSTLQSLGHECFYTYENTDDKKIKIKPNHNGTKEYPLPYFTYRGNKINPDKLVSYPFGKTYNKIIIYLPVVLSYMYKNNDYWKIYSDCIQTYSIGLI